MADDYRQRVKAAIDSVLDRPNGMAYRGTLPDAVLAVRDDELQQLRYERRLLGAARMVLDLVAAGDPSRWEHARQGAADVAQRIVDEIGHPVTDEPALGPELRERVERAEVELEATRAQLGDHGGGARHFKCVPVTRLAEKISEKRTALAQREEAVARCREALAEVARLRAGESPEPPAEGVRLTPAEWLRCYNDATPEKRLEVVEQVQDSVERAYRCAMADHENLLAARADEITRLRALLDGHEVADDNPEPEPGFENVTAHLGELQPTTCPQCGSDDLLTAKVCGLTSTSSRVMGEMAVCHGCGWSPWQSADDEVRVRREDLDLVMNGAGDATRMARWADACQRIRDALQGGQRR